MIKNILFFLIIKFFFLSHIESNVSLFHLNSDTTTFLQNDNAYQPDFSDEKAIPIHITLFYKIQEPTSVFLVISEGGKVNFDQKLSAGYDNHKIEYNHSSSRQSSDYRYAVFQKNRLRYNFYSNSSLQYVMQPYFNIRYPQDVLYFSLSPLDHQLNTTVYLHVPLGQYVPPGLYKDVIYMTLFGGDSANLAACEGLDTIEHMISINVPYRMSLKPYQSYFKAKDAFFSFIVLTNEPYFFEVESSVSLVREYQENPSSTGNIHFVSQGARKVIYKSFP